LSQQWFEADPELAGTLYVDGHVRLYHGDQAKLPRRNVSMQRLGLCGNNDCWVKDIPKWEQHDSQLLENVQQHEHEHEHELEQVKEQRKQTPHHIAWDQFPKATGLAFTVA
jgi:prepilin-type processing-associated H-X9-DG protein